MTQASNVLLRFDTDAICPLANSHGHSNSYSNTDYTFIYNS